MELVAFAKLATMVMGRGVRRDDVEGVEATE
jgi:hypothetical protein